MNREHVKKVRAVRKGKEYFTFYDIASCLNIMLWEALNHTEGDEEYKKIPVKQLKEMSRLSDDICYRVSVVDTIHQKGVVMGWDDVEILSAPAWTDSEEEEVPMKPQKRKVKQHIEEEEETPSDE